MSGFDSDGGSSLAIPVDSGGLERNNNKREEKRKRGGESRGMEELI